MNEWYVFWPSSCKTESSGKAGQQEVNISHSTSAEAHSYSVMRSASEQYAIWRIYWALQINLGTIFRRRSDYNHIADLLIHHRARNFFFVLTQGSKIHNHFESSPKYFQIFVDDKSCRFRRQIWDENRGQSSQSRSRSKIWRWNLVFMGEL